jgi:hypothetical protein
MSSSILSTIQSQLRIYPNLILMILGNIGNIFIVLIFSRQRQSACSIYLITSAIANDVYLTFATLVQIFPFYYGDEIILAFASCKIRAYIPNLIGQISKTMIILACIDRFMITNESVTIRAFSTPKRAKWLIFLVIIFWLLFCSHVAIMTTIINKQCGQFDMYSTIYTFYTIIFVGLIPSATLSVFGYLTYRNMRRRHIRIQPVTHNIPVTNNSIQRRDRDLLIIVISEVFIYLVTTASYPLILLETTISRYVISNKSVQYSQIENFIWTIAILLLSIASGIPFYVYLISSKSFRRDFKKLIMNGYRKLRRQPTILPVPRAHRTPAQQDNRV